jgi:hypothetical protein
LKKNKRKRNKRNKRKEKEKSEKAKKSRGKPVTEGKERFPDFFIILYYTNDYNTF